MKLSTEQIDRLYQFTRQHYVEYYDLQTELVDHLANAIEEQWEENPKISFEEVLQKEFKKFGVFGFMDVVEERQKALNKKYNLILWQHLKVFYTVPKIFGTLIFIGIVFKFLKTFNAIEDFMLYIITVLFAILILGLTIRFRERKRQFKLTGKKWLFDEVISKPAFTFVFSNLYLQLFLSIFSGSNKSDFMLWLGSFALVSFMMLGYIVLILIPSKAGQYLKETYPEYEFLK